ncbi:hypothetical protein BDZ94DRAFT_823161 [Collybia nuda]|uniref:Uncharacterized protein n=1 Tax=Collybia nuda TaxID=64659 RepID=A0A9P5Y505_9AGAR|nr:hypothetical protein BDZ94DRAFT_823161 [Collybia nuda]
MAVPSSSPPDVSQKESPKSSFQTPSPVTNQASELVDADAPPPAIPIPNGTAELQPAAHNVYDTSSPEPSANSEPHISADSAAGPTAGTGQSPASPSLSSTEAAASFAQPLAPSAQAPREPPHEIQKDKNGDKPGDPSIPLPTAQKSSSIPSRREGTARAPPAIQSNGSIKPKDSVTSRPPKPSFLSKLLRVLVPCVSPSPGAHPIELNDSSSLSTSKEKDISNSADHVVETKPPIAPTTTATTSPILPAGEPATVSTLDSTPVVPSTPPSAEGDVLLPPTPPAAPQLLPYSETEGLTSGAVQPPGSTGGGVQHEKSHSRDSTVPSNASEGEESEGTSFTEDDDMDGLDDEDDEDKLIMNGGVGIPIGPVGRFTSPTP